MYKLYERLILNRIAQIIEKNLIKNQAGFRPGKYEDGFKTKRLTGAVFIDLTAAYDTVNHNLLFGKVYKITKDYHLTKVIESLNRNSRFYVRLRGQKS